MTNQEIIVKTLERSDWLLDYKKGILNRNHVMGKLEALMELARTDENIQHAKKNKKQYLVKFERGYGGYTNDAVVVNGTKQWVQKRFITNWTESKPPKTVEAQVPHWLYKHLKTCFGVELIKELN